jgi:hypothetical protein
MPARSGLAAGIKPRGEERANILFGPSPPFFFFGRSYLSRFPLRGTGATLTFPSIEDSPQQAIGNLNAMNFIFIFTHLTLQQVDTSLC